MSLGKKLGLLALFLLFTYLTAWVSAYHQSKAYFEYAVEQKASGEPVTALKGMNKLELRIEDEYLGGFQQVIETWESSVIGPRPKFYATALEESKNILPVLTSEQLLDFIELYIQLDVRYVPEAAVQLLHNSRNEGNDILAEEMAEFLREAFPDYRNPRKASYF